MGACFTVGTDVIGIQQSHSLRPGDVVRLKTIGPEMTVLSCTPTGVECGWFYADYDSHLNINRFGRFETLTIPAAAVVLISRGEDRKS